MLKTNTILAICFVLACMPSKASTCRYLFDQRDFVEIPTNKLWTEKSIKPYLTIYSRLNYLFYGKIRPTSQNKRKSLVQLTPKESVDTMMISEFTDKTYFSKFGSYFNQNQIEKMKRAVVDFSELADVQITFLRNGNIEALLLGKSITNELGEKGLHIGFIGIDTSTLENSRHAKSEFKKAIEDGNYDFIQSRVDWFNNSSISFFNELGLNITKVELWR